MWFGVKPKALPFDWLFLLLAAATAELLLVELMSDVVESATCAELLLLLLCGGVFLLAWSSSAWSSTCAWRSWRRLRRSATARGESQPGNNTSATPTSISCHVTSHSVVAHPDVTYFDRVVVTHLSCHGANVAVVAARPDVASRARATTYSAGYDSPTTNDDKTAASAL